MELYLYVIPAAMAVLGVLFFFKTNVEKIKENPENAGVAQRNFFLGAAVSESIPMLIIVFAYLNMPSVPDSASLFSPVIIIMTLIAVSVFFILMQRTIGVPEESKNAVSQFSMIALAMANAIPLLAIVFIFISVS